MEAFSFTLSNITSCFIKLLINCQIHDFLTHLWKKEKSIALYGGCVGNRWQLWFERPRKFSGRWHLFFIWTNQKEECAIKLSVWNPLVTWPLGWSYLGDHSTLVRSIKDTYFVQPTSFLFANLYFSIGTFIKKMI